jgi:glycosyltransferase involved in cell wall biosynthesis
MISFIVIGRNEERNLKRTIEGIYKAVEVNQIGQYEIIYVDSKSTDRSIQVVAQFPEVKIYSITGECNAAIGRNAGAKEASGDALFFIDADMEINGKFLGLVYDKNKGTLNHDFVSGQLIDIFDDKTVKRGFNKTLPGGIFLIKRELWENIGGMRTKYRTGEDYDLGLRMIESGHRFKRISEVITNHYTVSNLHPSRIWNTIWNRSAFYPRCVLLRDHLFTKERWLLLWKNDKTFILLLLAIAGVIIYPQAWPYLLAAYLIAVVLRVVQLQRYLPFMQMIGYYLISDILNFIYLFTFYPKNKKEEYVAVNSYSTAT